MDNMFSHPLSQYATALTVIGIILIIWLLLSYVFTAITLFSIGKRRETRAHGLSWIPVLQIWTLGSIADKYDKQRGEKDHKWRIVLLVLSLLTIAGYIFSSVSTERSIAQFIELSESGLIDSATIEPLKVLSMFASMFGSMLFVGALIWLCSIGQNVCLWVCLYKLYDSCKPQKSVWLLLLATMIPFAQPFVMLACKNYDNGVNCKHIPMHAISD